MTIQSLPPRIFEVQSWREKQRFTRECVRDEIRMLKEEKNATELHLESLQVPLMVLSQCLNNRDQRVPPELTKDQLGEELNKVRDHFTFFKSKSFLIDFHCTKDTDRKDYSNYTKSGRLFFVC